MMQDTTPEPPEVPSGMTEDQAASELLKRWGAESDASPEPDEPEEDDAEQPEGDAQAEDESDEEGEESDDSVEIDVGGEKLKLPAVAKEVAERVQAKVKEIEAGATRKFQEAAELRKVAEAQTEAAQALSQISERELELRADARTIERRMQHIMSIDTASLAEQDPVALTKLNAEFNQLQIAYQRIQQEGGNLKAQSEAAQQAQEAERMKYLNDYAAKNIRGWGDDYSRTLLEFSVKELGADPAVLRKVMSEPVLKALDLAYRGWKVQTADPKAKQAVATKTLKPGSAGQMKSNAAAAAEKATQRLRKSGSVDDAAMALLMRSSAKRR